MHKSGIFFSPCFSGKVIPSISNTNSMTLVPPNGEWQNNGNYITYKSLSRKIQRTTLRSCLVSQCTSCDYGVITERVGITFWGTSTRYISYIVQVCIFLLFQYKLGMYCTYLSCFTSSLQTRNYIYKLWVYVWYLTVLSRRQEKKYYKLSSIYKIRFIV